MGIIIKSKKIGNYKLRFKGNKDAGAVIYIKNPKEKFDEEAHYMHFANGLNSYRELKSSKDVFSLMKRL